MRRKLQTHFNGSFQKERQQVYELFVELTCVLQDVAFSSGATIHNVYSNTREARQVYRVCRELV